MDLLLKQFLMSCAGGIIVAIFVYLLPRITTKSRGDTEGDIKELQKSSWTLQERLELSKELGVMNERLNALQRAHEGFLTEMKQAFIEVAHSPHTPELDYLLFKDQNSSEELLTPEEIKKLIDMLGEQARLEQTPGRQVALLGLRAIYKSQLRLERDMDSLQYEIHSLTGGGKLSKLWRFLRGRH